MGWEGGRVACLRLSSAIDCQEAASNWAAAAAACSEIRAGLSSLRSNFPEPSASSFAGPLSGFLACSLASSFAALVPNPPNLQKTDFEEGREDNRRLKCSVPFLHQLTISKKTLH